MGSRLVSLDVDTERFEITNVGRYDRFVVQTYDGCNHRIDFVDPTFSADLDIRLCE